MHSILDFAYILNAADQDLVRFAPPVRNAGLPAYCTKDLEFMGNILSGTKYRVSPEGVSLMDETNNLAKQVGRSPADS